MTAAAPRAMPDTTHPPYLYPPYVSTVQRAPTRPLVVMPPTLGELSGPVFGHTAIGPHDHDLTRQHADEPLGERMLLRGRLLDDDGRPVRRSLVEVWQANAAGRYAHRVDQHPAPLDPNFTGAGRCLTDDDGWFRFVTIKPGAYPWTNHANAWRPAHVHFSVFGPAFVSRLVTQMYFPGDPLLAHDPIYKSVPETARRRLVCELDLAAAVADVMLAYRFDLVVRGTGATPFEASPSGTG